MTTKRHDNKGRILKDGEGQDKDGQYFFRYTDGFGNRHIIRSWRLTEADANPPRKKGKASLREMEEELRKQLLLGFDSKKMTVCDLVDRYLATKINMRPTTKTGYQTVVNILNEHEFGSRMIGDIKYSDAKLFLIGMQKKEGKGYSSVKRIRAVLRPAFQMAFEDEMIKYNPFNFELANVLIDDTIRREAISPKDERAFLEFIKNDNHYNKYYDGFYILFKTGVRISELCGITIDDVNFKEHTLTIDKQLQREINGKRYIEKPKTIAGKRVLPITADVEDVLAHAIKCRKAQRVEPVVDGISNFLWLDKDGAPMVAMHWEKYMQHAVQKYNRIFKKELPKITPHICRHTYCTNMAKTGISAKTLQYLMGHSDISVTMNVYTHLGLDAARDDLNKVSKIKGGRRVIVG